MKKSEPIQQISPPVLYRTRDLARILHLSEQRVRDLIHAGTLQAVRVGVELRVRHEELERFLDSNLVSGKADVRDGRRHGRKPGPKSRTRSHRIAASFTPAEHKALVQHARRIGIPTSELLYQTMIAELERLQK